MLRKWNMVGKVNDIPLNYKFLLIYVLCVLIPILGINILFYGQNSKNTEIREKNNLQISLDRVAGEVVQMVNESISVGNAVSIDRTFNEVLETRFPDHIVYYDMYDSYLRGKLNRYTNIYPYISWLGVYTANPTFENGGNYFVLRPADLQSEWYRKINESKEKVILSSYIDKNPMNPQQNMVYVSIIRKLDDYPDLMSYNKYLRIDLSMDKLLELFGNEQNYLQVALVDEDNRIVLATNGSYKSSSTLLAPLAMGKGGDAPDGAFVNHLGSASYLRGWKLIGTPDYRRIDLEKQGVRQFFIWLTLVSTVIPTVLIYIILRSYNYRVKKLARHMELVKNEKFEPIHLYEGKDEIGGLLRSFNMMIEKIRNLIYDVYKLEIQKKDLELERVRAELNYLQSQMDPHFLFNTLNAILVVCKKNGYKDVTEIIRNLSQILRRLLSWKDDLVTLREELAFTEMYLQIEKFRFQDRFQYELDIDESVLSFRIPKMSIQPLVENSCKHGLQSVKGERRIKVSVGAADKYLQVKVEDNGIGIQPAKLIDIEQSLHAGEDSIKNIGLRNIYRRLDLFYESRFLFSIESREQEGTSVSFRIPLHHISEQSEAAAHV